MSAGKDLMGRDSLIELKPVKINEFAIPDEDEEEKKVESDQNDEEGFSPIYGRLKKMFGNLNKRMHRSPVVERAREAGRSIPRSFQATPIKE